MRHLFHITTIVSCLWATTLWAEIPSNYYQLCEGQKDSLLKNALFQTIRGGERYEYGCNGYHSTNNVALRDTIINGIAYTKGDTIWRKGDLKYLGTWCAFAQTDRHSDGRVWDMYSKIVRYFPHQIGESPCGTQIEHCVPKSWWGWSDKDTSAQSQRAYRDLFHLNPADARANGQKSNFAPGQFTKASKFDNGSFTMGKDTVWNANAFIPQDEYKGDFARAYFYIATAYADIHWDETFSTYVSNHSYLTYTPHLVDILLNWHRQDPVSQKEIDRANTIYNIQQVRNPYIDYPELVEYIWGNKKGEVVSLNKLISTTSSSYIPQEDYCDFIAYPAKDITTESFVASWSDFQTTYILDVYTKVQSARCDTLISVPALTTQAVKDNPLLETRGRVTATGAGSAALTMGVGTTDGTLVLTHLGLTQPAELQFRANIYQTATEGTILLYCNTTLMDTIRLPQSHDETFFRIDIPAQTDSIRLQSIGGSTSKRACIQELYLLQNCQAEEIKHITGYPKQTDQNNEEVTVSPATIDTLLFYKVCTQDGQWQSIEIPVLPPSATTNLSHPLSSQSTDAHLVLRNGIIYLIRHNKTYNLLGNCTQ